MKGAEMCTIFVPKQGEYVPIVAKNVHWQEEIVGTKGVDSAGVLTTKRVVWVFVPIKENLPNDLPELCGACYVLRGEVPEMGQSKEQGRVFTLMAAAKCDFGAPEMQHWELLLQ